ncbi:hypothetical protein Y032_0069g338 [Ancylostoma ceylanicum]|uniref:Uncharacterized protein n=1 Tax=Ancylostoma ceylanicum TaxID=53326 RepID=A0A016TXX8_9BILA|nr:hypothetical protein Y032_0069g338 [Ancylostoma ceylanicum]
MSEIPAPSPQVPAQVAASSSRFFGKREVSKHGKRDVLVYSIPETRMVYSFSHLRTNKSHDVYRCIRCQAQGSYVKIRVVGDEFLEDPCSIGHICLTRNIARETDTRKFYEDMQNVRKDENYVSMRTKQVWYKGLRERNECDLPGGDQVLRKELLAEYYQRGFKKRKRQIARNLAKHKDKRANMGFVPSRKNSI